VRKIITIGVIAAAMLIGGTPSARAETVYAAPYTAGPKGGDTQNHTTVDTATGTVRILRVSTTPGAIGCAATGGYAYLRVLHQVTERVTFARFDYADASLSPFAWLVATVRVGDEYIGSIKVRGPVVNDAGSLRIVFDEEPAIGDTLTIDFGLELASACPNVDGGTVRYPQVRVA
jgi:hypothetical protein